MTYYVSREAIGNCSLTDFVTLTDTAFLVRSHNLTNCVESAVKLTNQ